MTRKIVAIGGEKWRDLPSSTLAIDHEIIRLAKKTRPRFLFLPTAQIGESDEEEYTTAFLDHYASLSCEVRDLQMDDDTSPSLDHMADMLLRADIVYIGGGNTMRMLEIWKKHGFDKLLLEAWDMGKVMAGVSAGAICWFQSGHSDSMSFWKPDDWEYIMVEGFGVIPAVACPHFDGHGGPKGHEKPRREHFFAMMKALPEGTVGIALDNEAAIEVIDDTWRIIVGKMDKAAHRVYVENGEVIEENIEPSDEFRPMSELTRKGA